ncbi:macrocin-O-methyltransferase TylF [Roseibium hamelinense]|uniref:Macrocin-O-methyltransferase TylF n=1 Tax=Roseibium hamelinense TaxID=150831 RepID=A0A562T8R0_9HYPH|nr:TylF/MycF/NovP-related O-methyltransferase [Roseibium hamelinense]MTI43562.1 dTDP-6-deoxy-L-hexose 3-O-methyltransferase [Roseibium hamelinense]TWI89644.1 macrocin-O-methyltransferase TylF [Roseibium hamelinense]
MTVRGLEKSNVWDYENGFYWFSHKSRLNKILAHYELYKSIVDLPGHVFELGVYKGASITRLATFRDALENDFSRKIVGFDAFGEFPTDGLQVEDDLKFIKEFEGKGGHGLAIEELKALLEDKSFENFELVRGNVFDTLPAYLEKHPETRLAFLHLDMDVKEPTDFALELLYDRIVPGGLIVLDDYNAVAGETISVDDFIRKQRLKIEKLPFYNVPAYIRKPV